MKPFVRYVLGALLALVAATSAHAAARLAPSGITVTPGGGAPGDTVTVAVTFANSGAATTAPTNQNDFPISGTVSATVKFTNKVSGAFFNKTVTLTATGVIAENGGTGPMTGSITLPTQDLQAGEYLAAVTNVTSPSPAATFAGTTYSQSGTVLTVTGKPDLQITALNYAAGTSYVGGTVIPMSLKFRNNPSTNGTPNVPYVPGLNGLPTFVRVQVVLSSNPTFGDADDFQLTILDISSGTVDGTGGTPDVDTGGNNVVNANGTEHTFSWNQILPGNFTGSFYVMAKMDSLNALSQNDPPALTVNGNNIWGGNTLNPSGTLINLLPSNFPTTYLASHGSGSSTTANGYSDNPSISADGRYVAFASDATNLVSGISAGGADTNGVRDIFLFDSQTSTVRRLSLSQQGAQANGASNNPAISGNGRYVVFASDANNLVVGDTNGFSDIYVVDTLTGLISRVSGINAVGSQANNPSFRPSISNDGQFIVFESTATNLTGTATAVGVSHIYLHNRRVAGTGAFDVSGNTSTSLVDVDATTPATTAGNANAIQATISSDASLIAFSSKATNLVTSVATTAGRQHVYVRPRLSVGTATSNIKLVSVVNGTGAEGNADSQTASLNSDGRYVAFASLATNLVTGDTNGVSDIFVYDTTQPIVTPVVRTMSVKNGTTTQGTDPSASGFKLGSINPTISADGRYVAFASLDNDLTSGDTNGQAQLADSNNALDVFVHDRDSAATGTFDTGATATTMVSVNPFGYQTNGLLGTPSTAASNIYPTISANGRFVAFPTDAENTAGLAFGATNLLPLDSNTLRDVFLFDRRTNATVTPATPPTVTITSPGNGSQSLVNTAITVAASATTTVGQVASVQFFVDGNSLGLSTTFPYSASWTPTAVGVYNLSAIVTDTFGNIGVSSNVSVTITAAPSVGLTSPVNGTVITLPTSGPASVTVAATAAATAPGATVTNVKFFANGTQIGTTMTAPTAPAVASWSTSVIWQPTATGSYTLTSVTTDSNGNTTTSTPVTVTVATAGGGGGTSSPPTVVLTTPPATASINSRITLSATATAAAGLTITQVDFRVNGVSVGTATTAPYSVVWTPTVAGPYSITAVATDNQAGSATSTPAANVLVNGTFSVLITAPSASAPLPVNTPQTVTAAASYTNGTVTSVQFFANGTSIGSANAFPYTVSWTPATPGSYTLTAVGTNNAGEQTTSPGVAITVSSGTAPGASISSPSTGSTVSVGQPQVIVANASAGTGTITGVQFFANGVSLGSDTVFPYNFVWTPTGPGPVALTIDVIDSLGNRTSSAAVNVTVAATSVGAPTVAISSPTAGTSLPVGAPITVTAAASDADGLITGVTFLANGAQIGTDSTYPYSVTFTPTAVGTYTLTAIAIDDGGNVTTSAASAITVVGGDAPTVAIASPGFGATLDVNTTQTIVANAAPGSGVITSVEFFVNGLSLGVKNTFPYTIAWTPTAVGTYSLTARATNSFGNTTTSAAIVAAVVAGSTTLPKVSLTSPPNATSVTVGDQVFVGANATDPDGVITNVEFYVNDKLIGSKAATPYFALWTPAVAGVYTVKSIATDNGGNRATSSVSTVTVTNQSGTLPVTGLSFNSPAVDTPTGTTPPPAVDPFVPIKVDFGSKLIISADAVKENGAITNVQFFANGVNIGSLTAAPFFTTYQLNTLSDVTLIALVTDSAGNSVFTNPILISTQPTSGNADSLVTLVSPKDGATYVDGAQITFSATHNFGTVNPPKIDFYLNGDQFTTVTAAPYQRVLGITRAGTYVVHAVLRSGTTTTVSAPARITVNSSRAPSVALTGPAASTTYTVGTPLTIAANAASTTGLISNVQFFVNGATLSAKNTAPYTAAWSPGSAGSYTLTAIATDDSGNQTISAPLAITIVANAAPIVSVANPPSGVTVGAGTAVNLSASAADADGVVASVRFLANGTSVGTAATAAPFTTQWIPTAPGSYTIIAQATDNSGNVTNSTPVQVTVTPNTVPVVSLTAPAVGAVVRTGIGATLVASASDADGTITSVQFFANGTAVAAPVTTLSPLGGYRLPWAPTAEGLYRLTAVALDNAGASTTSSTVMVLAVSASSGGTENVYTGTYSGGGEIGRFAVINMRGKTAAFIGYSTTTPSRTYYYPGLPLDVAGSFSLTDAAGRAVISGSIGETGVSGSLDNNRAIFIGPVSFTSASGSVASGYYTGNLTGRSGSALSAIVGPDGSIMLYVADGSFQAAGSGSLDGTGAFSVPVTGGARFTGKVDPATGFLSGSLSGANGGAFMAATSSGVSFSDGFLRNLSTRGQVGTGSNILIGGFVVGGTVPKQVLVRAIGPTLANFGVTGALADPQLQLFNSAGALVTSNNNWGGSAEVANAVTAVSTFPLATNSLDAALVIQLAPGAYTAQISGVGSTTGIALLELYDVDSLQPFSSQKVMNVATRGVVGTSQGQLIAGFVVSGNTAKKVLIRGVGPTLAAAPFNVGGVLVDPVLRLVRGDNLVIRENDNWETGNDASLLSDAAIKVGAFPLAAGSKDSAMLLNLPPGIYNAQVTGSNSTTGVALIEVYEVP